MKIAMKATGVLLKTAILAAAVLPYAPSNAAVPEPAQFGPSNPFYAASTLVALLSHLNQ